MNLIMITDSGGGGGGDPVEIVGALERASATFGSGTRNVTIPSTPSAGQGLAVRVGPEAQVTGVTDNQDNVYTSRGDGLWVCLDVQNSPTTLEVTITGSAEVRCVFLRFTGGAGFGTDVTGSSGFAASHTINYTPPAAGSLVFGWLYTNSGGITSFTPDTPTHLWLSPSASSAVEQVLARELGSTDATSANFAWNSSAGLAGYRLVFITPAS